VAPFGPQQSSIDGVKQSISTSSEKRLHIKLCGSLSSDIPIDVEFAEFGIQPCVYKEEWNGYTIGWSETLMKHCSVTTVAEAPFLRLSRDSFDTKAPQIRLTHSVFAKMKTPALVKEDCKLIAPRFRATVFGAFLPYPYRYTHRVYAVRANTYHFATMDAILDDNGEIVLLPPLDPRRAFVLSDRLEIDCASESRSKFKMFAAISAACAAASISLFGGALL